MSTTSSTRIFPSLARACVLIGALGWASGAAAQGDHLHTPSGSGMPQGIPFFCANAGVTSVATGAWSNPATWSTKKVPGANDKVSIAPGHTVTYDATADDKIDCIEIRGRLSFKPDATTHMKVVTIMVLPEGTLDIG